MIINFIPVFFDDLYISLYTFSMYPLLVKDGLIAPTWSLCGLFGFSSYLLLPNVNTQSTHFTTKVMVSTISLTIIILA